MKATFNIPDDLYREVKARSALEGLPVREVVIGLFKEWLGQRTSGPSQAASDWSAFKPPLAHLVPSPAPDSSMEAMRESIAQHIDESV
jgi:hypothetical protein